MLLINCKVELELKWTEHCVLPMLGFANADNDDGANFNKYIFSIKGTILYVPVVTLSSKDNQ